MSDRETNLKSIVDTVKNITEGKWHDDIELNATGLIGELACYINQTLKNLRHLDESLGANVQDTPRAMSEVQAVIDHTEKATIKVLDRTDEILSIIGRTKDYVGEVRQEKDPAEQQRKFVELEGNIDKMEYAAYEIINAMEFQDVTQQKIMSIMSCLEGIEQRLVDLLIIFKIKESKKNKTENVEMLKNLHDDSFDRSNKQDLVDQLLSEFGI